MNDNLLEAFREYLFINKALELNSIKSYLSDLSQLSNYFDNRDLLKLDTMDIVKFLGEFENKRNFLN